MRYHEIVQALSEAAGPEKVLADDPVKWELKTKSRLRELDKGIRPEQTIRHGDLTLEFYPEKNDPEIFGDIIAVTAADEVVGCLFFGVIQNDEMEGAVEVHPLYRRMGIATAMYDFGERIAGRPFFPSLPHSPDAAAFWAHRRGNITEAAGLGKMLFVRATVDPTADLERNFSCVYNAWVDSEDEIADAIEDTYPEGADHLPPPRQDPNTGWWCWEPESGLSSFAFHDETSFVHAMDRILNYGRHLGQVAVFVSDHFELAKGADGEDLFRDGTFLCWLPLDANWEQIQIILRKHHALP